MYLDWAYILFAPGTQMTTAFHVSMNESFTTHSKLVAYGVWENEHLARVVNINYVTDSTSANEVDVTMNLDQPVFQRNVQVKYRRAKTVGQKGNYTWAGQTFGGNFESDGRPMGTEDIQSVTCTSTTQCTVKVPASGIALVFLSPTGGVNVLTKQRLHKRWLCTSNNRNRGYNSVLERVWRDQRTSHSYPIFNITFINKNNL